MREPSPLTLTLQPECEGEEGQSMRAHDAVQCLQTGAPNTCLLALNTMPYGGVREKADGVTK